MALVTLHVVYSIKDATEKISTMRIPFPANTDLAVLQEFAWDTAELIDPLIEGQIVDIGISAGVEFASANLKPAPLPSSDVEEGGYFSFRSAAGFLTGFTVPTFDESFVLPNSDAINVSDEDVNQLIQRVIEGHTVLLTNVSPSDSRGSDIESFHSARESFRSTRR